MGEGFFFVPAAGKKRYIEPMKYQGPKPESQKSYFEGWYFKLVTKSGRALALIPGVQHTKDSATSFIQLIDGDEGRTAYFEFSRDEFQPNKDNSMIRIQNNSFSLDAIEVDLKNHSTQLAGAVRFQKITPYQPFWGTPSIMGPFAYLPGMECRHGVLSVDHELDGSLVLNDDRIDFTGGRGYLEKDYGTSFPQSYVWLQSNNFEIAGDSFLLSLARIPYFGMTFPGFLGYLYYQHRWFRFGTYTGARIFGSWAENELDLTLQQGIRILRIKAKRSRAGLLHAPSEGAMNRRISESLDAEIQLQLFHKNHLEWSGLGKFAGMEIVGKVEDLGLSS